MNTDEQKILLNILDKVKSGEMSPEEAKEFIKNNLIKNDGPGCAY